MFIVSVYSNKKVVTFVTWVESAMAVLSSEIIFDYVSSEDLPSALKIEQEG